MKYGGNGTWSIGDTWGLAVDDVLHEFYLKNGIGETAGMGHVYTKDMLHYTACEDILFPLSKEDSTEDCLQRWTGCAMTGKDGRHYIFYTMRNIGRDQKIGVSISEDMEHFELYEGNPVLVPDPAVFNTTFNRNMDCRDMMIVYVEDEDCYYGYFAAMADSDYGVPVGVIGVAKSKDMLNWYDQGIAYIPSFMGAVEVPDVFCIDGKWYLTMLTGNIYGAKGISEDEDMTYFTTYAVADSPCGPFVHTEDRIFLGGPFVSGAVCRTVVFKGVRYVIYLDRGLGGDSITLPKEVKVINGNLRLCYTPILKQLRTGNNVSRIAADRILRLPTSHAWYTVSGNILADEERISLSTMHHSYQNYRLDGIKYPSVEIECVMSGDCTECGFMFEAYKKDNPDEPIETSFVSLNFSQNKVVTYRDKLAYVPCSKRRFPLERKREYHLRILVMEGNFEAYIDDVLWVQGPMETGDFLATGFMCGNGSCEIKNLCVYELEK